MTQKPTHHTNSNGSTATFNMTWDQVWDDAAERYDASRQPVPAQQAWRDAVAMVTLRAKDHYGTELHSRLDKAQVLVLGAHVTLDDGIATVTSETDSAVRYTVNGTCDCPDAQRNTQKGMCKHRLALMIYKRAVQEATALLELRSAASFPPDIPTVLPESPVSMNTHITIDGRQVQVTVRTGATPDDCHRVMVVMQEVLAEHPDTPTLLASTQAPLCPVHQTAMKVSKFGGYFCPRQTANGSHCNQKVA